MIRKEKRDKIVAQALDEIDFARKYKQGKVTNWQKNEDLYYGKKQTTESSRANVDLGRMQEFVNTVLSKIDNPLVFKFAKRKDAQTKRVARLNALRQYDSQRDFWDLKDLVGKKQAVIYGRAIYSYSADSSVAYTPHLENVDVYDYLIDPSAGGIDIERAYYMGRYGIVKTVADLKADKKLYIKSEIDNLIEGAGNADERSQEETNKDNRTYAQNVWTTHKEQQAVGKYKFWEWYTTFEGERYYLLLSETGACAIRVEKLTDVFASGLYPFWTWAAFPDLSEFWTPSFCDYVREIFMAQAVSINQMLDNAEQINKPQVAVDVGAVRNLAELKYRRNGVIKVTKGTDINKAVRFVETPPIKTPIEVFNTLEAIQEKASGVTAASKGVAEEDKVGIYEGNMANTAERFGLLARSYSFGYRRFAMLYEHGVREHLTKKIAVDILGTEGIEVEEISKRDIFRKSEEFAVLVESSFSEQATSMMEKRTKLQFLAGKRGDPTINQKKLTEIESGIVGFKEEEIRQLMDVSEFGDAEMMSEAERDIEMLLDDEPVEPNPIATTAYKQRFIDYLQDHKEDMNMEQFNRIATYIQQLDPIIMANTLRLAKERAFTEMQQQPPTALPKGNVEPLQDSNSFADAQLQNPQGGF